MMSTASPFCAAIDWGTSSFRLWIVDRDGSVLAERRSGDGMQSIGNPEGFPGVMESHLAEVQAGDDLPVVVCGMAGARQGWVEARYVDAPARLDSLIAKAVRVPGVARDVRILPGVAQRSADHPDVMRGEETQLLGAAVGASASRLFCMPGTHSKWVALNKGAINEFATFMTGELFDLLARESILVHAIKSTRIDPDDPEFGAAVEAGLVRPADIANRIFEIRPSQLLGFSPAGGGAARLSGLLIGVEIAGAVARFGDFAEVDLLAAGALSSLYARALEIAGKMVRPHDADTAVRDGLCVAGRAFWA